MKRGGAVAILIILLFSCSAFATKIRLWGTWILDNGDGSTTEYAFDCDGSFQGYTTLASGTATGAMTGKYTVSDYTLILKYHYEWADAQTTDIWDIYFSGNGKTMVWLDVDNEFYPLSYVLVSA